MSYIYQADIWCDDCGRKIKSDCLDWLEKEELAGRFHPYFKQDSDSYPQYVNNDESDCPQHCGSGAECPNYIELSDGTRVGEFLRNSLTCDGIEYVLDTHKNRPTEITEMWVDYYGLQEEELEEEEENEDDMDL